MLQTPHEGQGLCDSVHVEDAAPAAHWLAHAVSVMCRARCLLPASICALNLQAENPASKETSEYSTLALQDESSIQKAVVEANAFALAAHQFWGVWAILQAKYSPIDFDYVEYWALRWGEYHKRKDAFLAAVDDFLASSKS